MGHILVIHASSYGQTHRIADAIAEHLRRRGHGVDVRDGNAGLDALPSPAEYDAVVIGSRVQMGKHAAIAGDYVGRHRGALLGVATAFFSVSMSASEPRLGTDPHGYVRNFLEQQAWEPDRSIAFAGALPYRRYGWFLRQIMKLISKSAGHTTDTSRDHEFTDWSAVARFADEIDEALAARTRTERTVVA
jgi:menaquinone-dependent protoporphyrinogen oxidase